MTKSSITTEYCGDIHASKIIKLKSEWALQADGDNEPAPRALAVLLYGSWNARLASTVQIDTDGNDDSPPRWFRRVKNAAPLNINLKVASVRVDADEESYNICVTDEEGGLSAPPDLPALVFLGLSNEPSTTSADSKNHNQGHRVEHVSFNGGALESLLTQYATKSIPSSSSAGQNELSSSMGDALARLFDHNGNLLPPQPKVARNIRKTNDTKTKTNEPAIRIFVAGDRSQVGKSSICLGLLGALLNSGKYTPNDLAYIKPATQCEQTQLVEEFCKHRGISACVPVGPIVYYKGFTRAFLKGEAAETSGQMLRNAGDAVDKLALDKKVVIVDGVGYPAVGSITGTDNASVAKACGRSFSLPSKSGDSASSSSVRSPIPVLLIGKSGVGDAVDSFNINATYFTHRNVPVIGAIFNKLSLDGFYSLSNCKEAIELYFGQYQPDRVAFGFIPEIPSLKNARENVVANNNASSSKEEQLKQALETAELFVDEFSKYVNVDRILMGAKEATAKYIKDQSLEPASTISGSKRSAGEMENKSNTTEHAKHPRPATVAESKRDNSMGGNEVSLTREQIEAMASAAGAAGG